MAGIRDIKRAARRRLHDQMAVQALYIAVTGATPVPVTVRVHTRFDAVGQEDYSERADSEPKLVFRVSELPGQMLRDAAVVSVEAGEAYRIKAADPVDDAGYILARVARLTATQATGLPVPVVTP